MFKPSHAEAEVKKLLQVILEREQDIKSLEVKNGVLEEQLEKSEDKAKEQTER